MKILVKKHPELTLPTQANPKDFWDVYAASEPQIHGEFVSLPAYGIEKIWSRLDFIQFETNLYVSPQSEGKKDYSLELFPRSSISNKNLILKNSVGTIDVGYRGQILVRFAYQFQAEDLMIVPEYDKAKILVNVNMERVYVKGNKIAQLKPRLNIPVEWEIVDDLDKTERGKGGFGSSDRKA